MPILLPIVSGHQPHIVTPAGPHIMMALTYRYGGVRFPDTNGPRPALTSMKIQKGAPLQTNSGTWKLLLRWREQSLTDGWRVAGDWFVPEVSPLARSLLRGRPCTEEARTLGISRSHRGVGLAETMTDLRSLFTVSGHPVDGDALQELAVGWVEASEEAQPFSCTDVSTGLATSAHFERVVHDLCLAGKEEASRYVLGTIRVSLLIRGIKADWTLLADLGLVCLEEFNDRSFPAAYIHGAVRFLMPRSPRNFADALRCRHRLETLGNGLLGPCQLDYRSIPTTPTGAAQLLSELRSVSTP